jgi:hypothetical protein
MTQRPRNRRLDGLSWRIDRAADIVPTVLQHVAEQNALIGTCSAPGSTERRGVGGYSDPTLRTVLALDHGDQYRRAIDDAIATLEVCVNMLDEACRTALGYRAQGNAKVDDAPALPESPRCTRDVTVDGVTRRCDDEVEWWRRADGTIGYLSTGICARHRQADIREKQRERESAA